MALQKRICKRFGRRRNALEGREEKWDKEKRECDPHLFESLKGYSVTENVSLAISSGLLSLKYLRLLCKAESTVSRSDNSRILPKQKQLTKRKNDCNETSFDCRIEKILWKKILQFHSKANILQLKLHNFVKNQACPI